MRLIAIALIALLVIDDTNQRQQCAELQAAATDAEQSQQVAASAQSQADAMKGRVLETEQAVHAATSKLADKDAEIGNLMAQLKAGDARNAAFATDAHKLMAANLKITDLQHQLDTKTCPAPDYSKYEARVAVLERQLAEARKPLPVATSKSDQKLTLAEAEVPKTETKTMDNQGC